MLLCSLFFYISGGTSSFIEASRQCYYHNNHGMCFCAIWMVWYWGWHFHLIPTDEIARLFIIKSSFLIIYLFSASTERTENLQIFWLKSQRGQGECDRDASTIAMATHNTYTNICSYIYDTYRNRRNSNFFLSAIDQFKFSTISNIQ